MRNEIIEPLLERVPSRSSSLVYVLITAARNEAAFLEETIKSVVAQTVQPCKWLIVSDGSTDGTDAIVKRYAERYSWIELIQLPERRERHFGGKANAFNTAFARLQNVGYDVIGNLDADVTFDPDYFEFILKKLEQHPEIGVIGTAIAERGKYLYDYRFTSLAHVSGPCQIFRRSCLEEIGGYTPLKAGGVDFAAVWTARAKGWETKTFPERCYQHHRAMSSASHSGRRKWFYTGRMDYVQGNHPLWQLFRSVYQMGKRPLVIGGALLFTAYCWSALRQVDRIMPAKSVDLLQQEQLRQLKGILWSVFSPGEHGSA